jgi:hypothetical protein
MITVETIPSELAEELCRKIIADLPEYFGLPEANEDYAIGVRSRINLATKVDGVYAYIHRFPLSNQCEYLLDGRGTKITRARYW